MELRVLEYFIAIAQEKNVSAAANLLHVSQPTLSRQMMDLEKELGVTLFVRTNRGLHLSEEGKRLYKQAQEIITLTTKTKQSFKGTKDVVEGDIYIGAGETAAMQYVAKSMQSFQKKYPKVRFHLFSGNGDLITERIDKGLLDFGIVIEPIDITQYNALPLPHKDRWGILMRKDSLLAERKAITPQDLMGIPLLISDQTFVDKKMQQWMQKEESYLSIVGTYTLIYNASLLVKEGMGYVLGLDKLVETGNDSELCFRELHPTLEAKLDIVWKKSQVFSSTASLFLQYLKQEIEKNEQ